MKISNEDILDIFAEETSVDRARLTPEATLKSLDIASLDIISVSFAIEDKFGLIVDADAFAGCATLQDVIEMIQTQAAAPAA